MTDVWVRFDKLAPDTWPVGTICRGGFHPPRLATHLSRLAFADDCHRECWCQGCALPCCDDCADEIVELNIGEVWPLPPTQGGE